MQLNAFVVSYIFSVAAAWIIVSATRHDAATDSCVSNFFATNSTDSTATDVFATGGQGETVCNIFVWADVGIMGGLWLIMLIFQVRSTCCCSGLGTDATETIQFYLILVCRWYGASQLADHSKYYSIYSVTAPDGIGLGERQQQDAWDPRPSTDSWSGTGGGFSPAGAGAANPRTQYRDHSRHNSDATERGYGVGAQDFQNKPSYGYQDSPGEQSYNPYVNQPDQAYTNEAEPTPVALVSPDRKYGASQAYGSGAGSMAAPPGAMYPNEGQFGRKTPKAENAYGAAQGTGYAASSAPSYHTDQPHYYQQR